MDEYQIPLSNWHPLSPADVSQLFAKSPFTWAISGGYVTEQFLGRSIREHSDMDIAVFRDEQLRVQSWLADWQIYAADPPGTLRLWHNQEYLLYGIHDIWGHRLHQQAWELQIMLNEIDGINGICGETERLMDAVTTSLWCITAYPVSA